MRGKSIVPHPAPSDNGPPPDGDAHEPGGPTDTTFDPATLEASGPGPQAPGPDPFDPAALRLSPDLGVGLGLKKALLSVPVRKPDKSWFIRVHPSPEYRLQTAVIELKEDRETYLVARDLWPQLAGEPTFSPRALFTALNRQGDLFLWPIRLPRADGKVDEWSRTALESADMAAKGWVRVTANMALGGYEVWQATGSLPDPEWPRLPFREILRIAFKVRWIDTVAHPVLRRLRGEA
jgi:hypothetical protein